jgi:ferric-dicitrate binding protein FerR (iron transport regulator)
MTHRDHNESIDTVGRLLKLAGEPDAIPAERMQRARATVRAHWQKQVQARKTRTRWTRTLAIAASVILLVNAGYFLLITGNPAAPPVQLVHLQGESTLDGVLALTVGGIDVGQEFHTGPDARAGLNWSSGHDLRLDHNTRISINGEREMTLVAGRIYVDSGTGPGRPGPLTINTPLGPVRDIGTQFEVTAGEQDLTVRVREGRVEVNTGNAAGDTVAVEAGFQLQLAENKADKQQAIETHGDDWDWTYDAAAPFEVEGRSLNEFLGWISRQNGWNLSYDNLRTRRTAEQTLLHGSIAGLSAEQALDSVLRTYQFDFRLEQGTLHIDASNSGD